MVEQWVKDLVEEEFGENKIIIGGRAIHIKTNKEVKIISGRYWGDHGISNFWYWREVESNKEGCGYGTELKPC
jgi:hypothetical protein